MQDAVVWSFFRFPISHLQSIDLESWRRTSCWLPEPETPNTYFSKRGTWYLAIYSPPLPLQAGIIVFLYLAWHSYCILQVINGILPSELVYSDSKNGRSVSLWVTARVVCHHSLFPVELVARGGNNSPCGCMKHGGNYRAARMHCRDADLWTVALIDHVSVLVSYAEQQPGLQDWDALKCLVFKPWRRWWCFSWSVTRLAI